MLFAVVRLSRLAVAAVAMPWELNHWVFLSVWIPFMAYSEGYRGFQLRFSPMVVSRAWHLAVRDKPEPWKLLLAPLFAMGFFCASRKRLLTSWLLTVAIVGFVWCARQLPQPWRGLVDIGVVVGLGWGIVWIGVSLQEARRFGLLADPQLPQSPQSSSTP